MAIHVIGYDLHPKQGETYSELIEAIKKVGSDWWHCLDSTWLVVSTRTAVQIRDELWQHMKADDQLLVVKYDAPDSAWIGFTKDDCSEWLKRNM
jgi:hypothetical protein